jgi:hypothetical protein
MVEELFPQMIKPPSDVGEKEVPFSSAEVPYTPVNTVSPFASVRKKKISPAPAP